MLSREDEEMHTRFIYAICDPEFTPPQAARSQSTTFWAASTALSS
jgi:hypothetical protein